MSIFKALLLSALAVTAKAAPTEVVAGRVVTHAVPSLTTLHSSPVLHAVRGVPAVTGFHSAPAFHAVQVAPAVTAIRTVEGDSYDAHPQYNFGYSITDSVTGDSKTREESRDGDVVTGSYSVADPDGRIRTVTYTADDVHGFQATVTYDGQEGPVAIPFDAPSTAVVRSEPVHVAVATAEPAPVNAVRALDNALRTVPTIQAVQANPAVHAVHHSVNAVRTIPTLHGGHAVDNTVTALHAVQPFQSFRTVQAIHPFENTVRTVPFRTVQAFPASQAVHAVHNLGQAVTAIRSLPVHPVHTAARTVPATTAFHSNPVQAVHNLAPGLTAVRSLQSAQPIAGYPFLLRNAFSGNQDLSQFHFVTGGQVVG